MSDTNIDVTSAIAQLRPRASDRRVIATLADNMTVYDLRHAADAAVQLPGRDAAESKRIFNTAIAWSILDSDDASDPYSDSLGQLVITALSIAPVFLLVAGVVAYLMSIN